MINKSKKIVIKRKEIFNLPGLTEDMKSVKIGSSFTVPPLNEIEKQKYMPKLLGINSNSDMFENMCKEYFYNISVDVPVEGLELEIGFSYPNEALAESEDITNENVYPINIKDYVLYRYCQVYSRVANSFEDVNKSNKILFYFYDKNKELMAIKDKNNEILKATSLIPTLFQNQLKVKQVYTIYNSLIDTTPVYDIDNKEDYNGIEVAMYDIANKNPKLFIKILNDKNLEYTFFIAEALRKNIIRKIPNTTTIVFEKDDNAVTLGNSYVQAITYLKNEKNQILFNEIKSTLKMLSKNVDNVIIDNATQI
jgi:hypothetical protein